MLTAGSSCTRRPVHRLDNRIDLPTGPLKARLGLRVDLAYDVLGRLFGLKRSNARDALVVLGPLADFPFEGPAPEHTRPGTKQAVSDAYPQVKPILDGREQPCQRPRGWDEQEPFDSAIRVVAASVDRRSAAVFLKSVTATRDKRGSGVKSRHRFMQNVADGSLALAVAEYATADVSRVDHQAQIAE